MLTYHLDSGAGPLYKQLYDCMKQDIENGKLSSGEKVPSKRTLARNLGISTITVETAYSQLIGEGYLYTLPKKGYYVSDLAGMHRFRSRMKTGQPAETETDRSRSDLTDRAHEKNTGMFERRIAPEEAEPAGHPGADMEADRIWFDFSSNRTAATDFPFSIWAKCMRETISMREQELMEVSPSGGVEALRLAIADHLASFRGMSVDPAQIIIGAGTEYLYTLLIRLLGQDKVYCIENPGYRKLLAIYRSSGAACRFADVDSQGMIVGQLRESGADIAHISPTHHFPTGVTMPVSRRYEMLAWAGESGERYIIEDDYDSEFRLSGRPIPSLMSIDRSGTVIYLNTFTKSVAPTIRISYMVLPEALLARYRSKLGFYSCTVANYEQYILAEFIRRGHFEKHINRMRNQYRQKRDRLLDAIRRCGPDGNMEAEGADAGLHFLLHVSVRCGEEELSRRAAASGVRIFGLGTYALHGVGETDRAEQDPCMVVSYSGLTDEQIPEATRRLKEAWSDQFVIAHTGKKRYNPK